CYADAMLVELDQLTTLPPAKPGRRAACRYSSWATKGPPPSAAAPGSSGGPSTAGRGSNKTPTSDTRARSWSSCYGSHGCPRGRSPCGGSSSNHTQQARGEVSSSNNTKQRRSSTMSETINTNATVSSNEKPKAKRLVMRHGPFSTPEEALAAKPDSKAQKLH